MTYSDDRQWWWDGTRWVPASQAPGAPPTQPVAPGPGTPPPRGARSRRKPVLIIGAVALILLFGICTAAVANSGGSSQKPQAKATAKATRAATAVPAVATAVPAAIKPNGSCAPQPCQNDSYGWTVYASSLVYNYHSSNQFDQAAEAGNVFVKFDLTFENKTDKAQSANLFQFQLLDAAGVAHHSGLGTVDCPFWSDVVLAPGGKLGPKCTVFEASAGNASGLTLLWIPQSLGGGYRIKLT